jgi:Microsomal signal peptidase 12 kDa subunit (SPC12)
MDYKGQELAELIFYIIICSFGAVGWVIGYFHQDFTIVFQAWLVGVVISVVVRNNNRRGKQFVRYIWIAK